MLREPIVDLVGAAGQRAHHAAAALVGLQHHHPPDPALEQLGQGILHQRQRAGLLADILEDRADQVGGQRDASALGRADDRALQLLGRQRRHHLGALAHQLAQAAIEQWAVVEIGAQRHNHAQPRLRVGHSRHQAVEEVAARGLVLDQRKDLLELVDHQHQLGVARQQLRDDIEQAALVALELLEQIGRLLHRHAQQRGGQLGQRLRAGDHFEHKPLVRARQRAAPQRRNQAGAHDRRLAAAARPDHRQESRQRAGFAEPRQQPLGQRLAAKELGCIGLLEGAQALVGILARRHDVLELHGIVDRAAYCAAGALAVACHAWCVGGRRGADAAGDRGRQAADGPPEVGDHAEHIGVAVIGLLGGGALNDRVQRIISSGRWSWSMRDLLVHMLKQHDHRRRPVEGQLAGQDLIEHDPQAIDIGARADWLGPDLLGRDIGRRADHHAGPGDARLGACSGLRLIAHILGDAKIGQVGVVVLVQQDSWPASGRDAPRHCGARR